MNALPRALTALLLIAFTTGALAQATGAGGSSGASGATGAAASSGSQSGTTSTTTTSGSGTTTTTQGAAGGAAKKEDQGKAPYVSNVAAEDQQLKEVMLGDTVVITVENDATLRDQAKDVKTQDGQSAIRLFLNGQDSGLVPINGATSHYTFRLERTDDNSKLWMRILEAPFAHPKTVINLSVGLSGKTPLPTQGNDTLSFRKSKVLSVTGLIWIALLIVVLWYFFHLARTTDILRNGPEVGGQKQAYSLGRSQMAWWLFIIIVGYVTIWAITGNRDTVSNTALILMGISGATALGSVAIDATASTRIKAAIDRLNSEKTALQAQAAAAAATNPALAQALNDRIAAIDSEMANIVTQPASVGWLQDILTDDNGAIALHRFQILLWTFVLGIVFIVAVGHVLSMPEFSATLLALMGISNGTYLGFKFPTTG